MNATVTTNAFLANPITHSLPIATSLETEVVSNLAGKIADLVFNTYQTMDRFLALPIPGAAAETIESAFERKGILPNCFTPDCPDIDKTSLHPREKQALDIIGYERSGFADYFFSPSHQDIQEYARFKWSDERDKVLWAAGAKSQNDILHPKHKAAVLVSIAGEYDLKYTVSSSFEELCEEINEGVRMGHLAHVIIDTHGNPDFLILDSENKITGNLDFKTCFQHLDPSTKITILAAAGAPRNSKNLDNLAQKIANASGRAIVSATEPHSPLCLQIDSLKPLTFKQLSMASKQNIHRTFYPNCDKLPSTSPQGNCLCPPCADLDPKSFTDRELAISSVIAHKVPMDKSYKTLERIKAEECYYRDLLNDPAEWTKAQENLRLHRSNPNDKTIYFIAKEDHNSALSPILNPTLLYNISNVSDIKIVQTDTLEKICSEIKNGALTGKLSNVIIHAHGAPDGIFLSTDNEITKDKDLASCFSGLDPAGKIILFSCLAGSRQDNDAYNNIAQEIADQSRRTVIASRESSNPAIRTLQSVDPITPIHPSEYNPNLNIYTIFHPRYPTCPKVEWKNLNDREKLVLDTINDHIRNRGLQSLTPEWEKSQDYFRTCEKDPKNATLYLSAAKDETGALDPRLNPDFLFDLSDKSDLNFRAILTYEQMCSLIKEAGKTNKLAVVMIHAPYQQEVDGLRLWSTTERTLDINLKNETVLVTSKTGTFITADGGLLHLQKITQSLDGIHSKETSSEASKESIDSCFSGLKTTGRIVLLSSQAGAPRENNPFNNTAQKMADKTQRIVVASTGDSYSTLRKVTSMDPFMLFHPQQQDPKRNSYQVFYPTKPTKGINYAFLN